VACRTTRSTLLRPVAPSAARRTRSPPRSRGGVQARLDHARLPAGRTLDDRVLLGQRSGPGGRELQLETDELGQAHPPAARELEPVAEEERARVTDDLPGQEPIHLGMRGLTGGHDLEQTALVGDASDLASVTEHGHIGVGREAPHLHDLAESGGVTTDGVECAIGSHGDPPVGGNDVVVADVKGRGLLGGSRQHKRPRRPSRWATRAPKTCARTRSSGIAASPEGHIEE